MNVKKAKLSLYGAKLVWGMLAPYLIRNDRRKAAFTNNIFAKNRQIRMSIIRLQSLLMYCNSFDTGFRSIIKGPTFRSFLFHAW